MKTKDKLSLISLAFREGWVESQVKSMAIASRIALLSQKTKMACVGAMFAFYYALFLTPQALAASGCDSGAATKLVGFLNSAAQFMMAIGAAAALLMFAVGAVLIIGGGTGSRVSKGFTMLKNAVIGLIVLAAGIFIKTVVLAFVGGATGGSSTGPNCVKKGSTGAGLS